MDKRLLDILVCPTTRLPLRVLTPPEIATLNRAIGAGQVSNHAGTQITTGLADGLLTRDGKTIYRIEDDIPVMLASEAIATAQVRDFPSS